MTPENAAQFIAVALERNDPERLIATLRSVARARGMSRVARAAGLRREYLYRVLAPGARPRFDAVVRIARALGVEVSVRAAVGARAAPGRAGN